LLIDVLQWLCRSDFYDRMAERGVFLAVPVLTDADIFAQQCNVHKQ
jgi:hypothetical protein